jgi:Ca2+/H+ antiporter
MSGSLFLELPTFRKFRAAIDLVGGGKMSKIVMVVLWFLVGLCLLVGGLASMYTAYCLDVAGILIIILAIVLQMKKMPEGAPVK